MDRVGKRGSALIAAGGATERMMPVWVGAMVTALCLAIVLGTVFALYPAEMTDASSVSATQMWVPGAGLAEGYP